MEIFYLLAGNRIVSNINKMEQPLELLPGFLGLYCLVIFYHSHHYSDNTPLPYISRQNHSREYIGEFYATLQDYNMFKTGWSRDLCFILLANCWYLWINLLMDKRDLFYNEYCFKIYFVFLFYLAVKNSGSFAK